MQQLLNENLNLQNFLWLNQLIWLIFVWSTSGHTCHTAYTDLQSAVRGIHALYIFKSNERPYNFLRYFSLETLKTRNYQLKLFYTCKWMCCTLSVFIVKFGMTSESGDIYVYILNIFYYHFSSNLILRTRKKIWLTL